MELTVMNRQRKVRFDIAWLRRAAAMAIEVCGTKSGDGRSGLVAQECIEVAVVSDATIARVHRDFMNMPGATDVITFDHGEIVLSAETAMLCAREHGHSVEEELALYVIHGLLHLNGFDDRTPGARRKMVREQERIWRKVRATA